MGGDFRGTGLKYRACHGNVQKRALGLTLTSFFTFDLQALFNMGKLLSKIFGNKEMRILMLGLDAAGKTSILLNLACSSFLISLRHISCPYLN